MMWSRFRSQDEARPAPFVLERRFEDVRQGGYFTPRAGVWIMPALHESGLLRELAPDDLRVLLAVVSSVSGNGDFIATPELLAPVLGLSSHAARVRLERLLRLEWNGEALLTSHTSESGLRFFRPAPHLLDVRSSVISPAPAKGQRVEVSSEALLNGEPVSMASRREEVIAHSRRTYARPRAEVEAEINRFLSREKHGGVSAISEKRKVASKVEPAVTPETREWLRLKRALVEVGVPHHRADELLEAHPAERIARQLEWLPLRGARSPLAYLLAAIERDYAPPKGVIFPPTKTEGKRNDGR